MTTYTLNPEGAEMLRVFAADLAAQVSDPGVRSMTVEFETTDGDILAVKVTRKGAKVKLPDGTKVPLDELLEASA